MTKHAIGAFRLSFGPSDRFGNYSSEHENRKSLVPSNPHNQATLLRHSKHKYTRKGTQQQPQGGLVLTLTKYETEVTLSNAQG